METHSGNVIRGGLLSIANVPENVIESLIATGWDDVVCSRVERPSGSVGSNYGGCHFERYLFAEFDVLDVLELYSYTTLSEIRRLRNFRQSADVTPWHWPKHATISSQATNFIFWQQ